MPRFTIADIPRRWARETADAPAVTYDGVTCTWAELHRRSAAVGAALVAEGVGPQDRVAFLDKNSTAWFEVFFGAAMANAVDVPVNWRLAPPEVAAIVNDSCAKVLFVGEELLPVLRLAEPALTTVKRIVVVGRSADHLSYEDWLAGHAPDDPGVSPAEDDAALQLYTSGTTGLPKGVMLTNGNLEHLAEAGALLGIDAASVVLVPTPLFHIGGCGWALFGMLVGSHTVLMREFDVQGVLDVVPRYRVTHAVLVPAMLLFVTGAPGADAADLASMQVLVYGASPITDEVLEASLALFGCDFYQMYGLTETTGAVTILPPEDHVDPASRQRLRSAGRPMAGTELRVVDAATGGDAAPGAVGEVWIRSPQVMKGYWNNDEETRRAVVDGGWLRTGDAGYLEDGYLYLFDRVKDMIVCGGENVYPAEVENVLMKHPGVADVAVIGVPSERWGEEPKAVVVPAEGHEVQPEDLIAFARSHLAGYKIPRSVDLVPLLPRNPSGKVLKTELRAPYWEGHERRIR